MKRILQEHHYPRFVFRHPGIINWAHRWNALVLQRNSLTNRQLGKWLQNISAGSLVLDAGFGDGQHLFGAAKRFPALRFWGIDKHEKQVEFGRLYASRFGLQNVSFSVADLAALNQENLANLALCVGVLQYIEADEAALANLFRALKPDGCLLLYVPVNGRSVLPFFYFFSKKMSHYESRQQRKRVYQADEITSKLEAAGFLILEKRFTYSWIGIAAHEGYSLLLMLLGNAPLWGSWIFALLVVLYLPFLLLLNTLDKALPKRTGNGLMILAKKS